MICSKCKKVQVRVGDNTDKVVCWICSVSPIDNKTAERNKNAEKLLKRSR